MPDLCPNRRAGRFDIYLDYACADNSAGNLFRLEGTEPAVRGKITGSGGWDKYRQDKIGTVELPAGFQRLTLRPDAQVNGALMDLRALYLVPPGQAPKANEKRAGSENRLGAP